MKATERTLAAILHSPDQYVIPLFQRYYSWGQKEWETLWADLLEVLDPEVITKRHFLGSLVVVAEPHTPGITPSYQVIDGQQRLATLSILLCALRDGAKTAAATNLAAEIQENYIVHKFKEKRHLQRYKIYPRFRDREDYLLLAETEPISNGSRIALAYHWFNQNLQELTTEDHQQESHLRQFFTAVTTRLDFVMITLDPQENVYKIFRSLNATGLPLAEADLIRNHIFMSVPFSDQDLFDQGYWRPLETHFEFDGKLDGQALTEFFRDVLMSGGGYVGRYDTYDAFQRQIGSRLDDPKGLVQNLLRQADHYEVIRGRRSHTSSAVETSLQKIRELRTSTTFPLLLALFERKWKGEINDEELTKCFEMISSFTLRRYICGESSRAYSRWFVAAAGSLGPNVSLKLASFLRMKGWPEDDYFKARFIEFDLYRSEYAREVLVALEKAIPHRERADLSNVQIEHVMPQTLTEEWKGMLGEHWQEDHWRWINTPGNLTLTAYNPTLGNRPFGEKKKEFAGSNILLNRHFRHFESWSKQEIEDRGKVLAEIATSIWMSPSGVTAG